MQTAKTKEINGKKYQVAPFMAIEALKIKMFLVKKIGPALGEFMGLSSMDNEIDGNVIAKVIEKLTETLDEDSFVALIKRLMQNVICNWTDKDGQSRAIAFGNDFNTAMNEVFCGELFSIYPVIGFVLEVNYPDFFGKIIPVISQKTQATGISKRGRKK